MTSILFGERPRASCSSTGRTLSGLLLASSLLLTACGDDPAGVRTAREVEIVPGDTTVEIGASVHLTAEAKGADGKPLTDRFVHWTATDGTIAHVTSDGEVFALGRGTTLITATVDGISAQAQLVVVPPRPAAPTVLEGHWTGTGAVHLRWQDNSSYEDRFEVSRFDPATSTEEGIATLQPDQTEFTDTGVSEGPHEYRVRACNSTGCSAYTAGVEVRVPPAAPSELEVVEIGTTFVALYWQDNSGIETSFTLIRSSPGTASTVLTDLEADRTSFRDENLEPGTLYGYRIRACDGALCSDYSLETEVQTSLLGVPTAPSTTAAELVQNDDILVTWQDNSDTETFFQVERATGSEAFSTHATVGANIRFYLDDQAALDTRYRYRVSACNGEGCSASSTEAFLPTRPTAPATLSATPASETRMTLDWSDGISTETEFRIERQREGGAFSFLASVSADTVTYVDEGLQPGDRYGYRVSACNESGCSTHSPEASATLPVTSPPAAPNNLLLVVQSTTPRVGIYWSDNSEVETRFEVERKPEGGSYALLATVGPGTESHIDSTVVQEATYFYRVRACGDAGCSAYTAEGRASMPLIAPTDLTPTILSSTEVQLTWTDNSQNETRYELERAEGDPFVTSRIFLIYSGTTFVDTGLQPATEYRYRVRACDEERCSSRSEIVSVITPP